MNNHQKVVITDNPEAEQKYKSNIRGKVQDRNVSTKMEPMYAPTYYEKVSDVKWTVHYYKCVDNLNRAGVLLKRLYITNVESPLTEEQMKFHFALIDTYTPAIVENPQDARIRFSRAPDFCLVQDSVGSIEDLTQAILLDDKFFPTYFIHSLARCKQLECQKAEGANVISAVPATLPGISAPPKLEISALGYDIAKSDLDHVIPLALDFVYVYYNHTNILAMSKDYHAAIVDCGKAIGLNKELAEAYFNRGLTHIFPGNNKNGIADLDRVGELGIVSAYNILKRFIGAPEQYFSDEKQ